VCASCYLVAAFFGLLLDASKPLDAAIPLPPTDSVGKGLARSLSEY
jgi:hypothetical protein